MLSNLSGKTNIYINTQLKTVRFGQRTREVMSALAAGMRDAPTKMVGCLARQRQARYQAPE